MLENERSTSPDVIGVQHKGSFKLIVNKKISNKNHLNIYRFSGRFNGDRRRNLCRLIMSKWFASIFNQIKLKTNTTLITHIRCVILNNELSKKAVEIAVFNVPKNCYFVDTSIHRVLVPGYVLSPCISMHNVRVYSQAHQSIMHISHTSHHFAVQHHHHHHPPHRASSSSKRYDTLDMCGAGFYAWFCVRKHSREYAYIHLYFSRQVHSIPKKEKKNARACQLCVYNTNMC